MTVETDAPASILAEVMRVALLDATGATIAGAGKMYVTDAITRFTWQPDIEGGLDLTQRKGNGDLCVMARTADIAKRYTCTLEICAPDPELEQLLSGGVVLTATGVTVGYGAPVLGTDPVPNGVSIEIWSKAISGDVTPATNPLFWWAFPKIKLEKKGTRELSPTILANVFEGYMYENPSWGNGPNNDWLVNSDRTWQYQRCGTGAMPPSAIGLQAIPTQV